MTQAEPRPGRRLFLLLFLALLVPLPLVLFRRYLRPTTLKIVVDGPFPIERFLSPIVEPVTVTVFDEFGPDYGEADLDIHFRFKGPESGTRLIKVRVAIRDSDGHIIYRHSENSRDQRYFAKLPRHGIGTLLPENHLMLTIPQVVAKKAARIELVFQDV